MKHLIFLFSFFFITSFSYSQNSQWLGGEEIEDAIKIRVETSGTISVDKYSPKSDGTLHWGKVYDTGGHGEFPLSNGLRLMANNTSFSTGYFNGTRTTEVSNIKTGSSVITTLRAGGLVEISQVTTHHPGSSEIGYKWVLKNISNAPVTDLHFFRGVDTYLINTSGHYWTDKSAGSWDAATHTVGNSRFLPDEDQTKGKRFNMLFSGITIPDAYEATDYRITKGNVNAGALANKINTDVNSTSKAMALQWDKTSLGVGESWTILAVEKIAMKHISDKINVTAPIGVKVKPGGTADLTFKVKDIYFVTYPISPIFSVSIEPADWSATIKSPTSQVQMHYDETVDVVVTVTAPANTPVGTNAKVTLNAQANGDATAFSSVVTESIPVITSQPSDIFACELGTKTFSVTANDIQSYQWQVLSPGANPWQTINDGGVYSGASTATLTMDVNDVAFNGNKYRCGLIENNGVHVFTIDANLTVDPFTLVDNIHTSMDGCIGAETKFSISATGGGTLSYQWQKDGIDLTTASATTSDLVIVGSFEKAGSYACIVSTSCGDVSSHAIILTVSEFPVVAAPADATHCEGDMITLTAIGYAQHIGWIGAVADGVPFAATTTTAYAMLGITNGCIVRDTVVITVNPTPHVQAGADKKFCEGAQVTLKGEGTADTYVWDNGITDNVGFIPTPGSTTTYTATGTVTTTGCTATDEVVIETNNDFSILSFSKAICVGESVDISTAASGGTPPYTYHWSSSGNAITGATSTLTVSPAATTTYSIEVKDSFIPSSSTSGCSVTGGIIVTVNPAISVVVADQSILKGESVDLTAHATGGNGNYTYLWSEGGATTATISVSPTATTIYSVVVSDDFVSSNGTTCDGTSNDATVTVTDLPTFSVGSPKTICEGEEITLTGSDGALSYVWDNGVVNGVAFEPTATTTYTATGTDLTTGGTNTSSVTITVTLLTEAIAGAGATICSDTYTLTGNTPVNGTGLWSSADNTLVFVDATNPTTSVSNLIPGINTLAWTITNNVCSFSSILSISRDAQLPDNAGPDDEICGTSGYTLQAAAVAGGGGTWTGPAGVLFLDANDPLSVVNNLGEGENILTWTVSGNACANGVDQVTITKYLSQPAIAGSDQTVCENQSSVIMAAIAPNKGTGIWTSSNPHIVFADPNSATTEVTSGLAEGVNGFTWTTTNGTCTESANMIITLENLPVVNASPDASICDATSFQIGTQTSNNGVWSSSDPTNVSFANATANVTIASGIQEGATTFTWTVTSAVCGDVSDEMVITSSAAVVAEAGLDIVTCDINTVTLSADVPIKGTGLWTSVDPFVIIDNPTSPTTTISNLAGGTGFFWTVTNGSCQSTDNTLVNVHPLPIVIAPPPLIVCAGTPVTLNGFGASVLTWDNGVIDGKEFTPTATTTYTVIGKDAAGCTNTAQTTVTVNPIPVVDAGTDIVVCAGESVTLTATGADSYLWTGGVQNGVAFTPATTTTYTVNGFSLGCDMSDDVTVTVHPLPAITTTPSYNNNIICANHFPFVLSGAAPTGGVFSGAGIATNQYFDATLAGSGTHTITYTYTETTNQCSNTSTFDMEVGGLPTIIVTVADPIICEKSAVLFVASGGLGYVWEGDSIKTDSAIFLPPVGLFSAIVDGVNMYGCSNDATGSAEVEKQPNAGTNNSVILNATESTLLDLLASLGGTPDANGLWTDDSNSGADISDPTAANFVGVRHGDYNFTHLVESLVCPADSAVLAVEVDYLTGPLPFSPNEGFSPNGDGVNDTWFIADIEKHPNNNVRILNRSGEIVFEITGYVNDTKAFEGRANVGSYGSAELQTGTYFYVIDLGDGSEAVSGFFTLLR